VSIKNIEVRLSTARSKKADRAILLRRGPAGAWRSSIRPAGLAAADQLNRAGHLVTVFERVIEWGSPSLRHGSSN
jgi:hypothetical protein